MKSYEKLKCISCGYVWITGAEKPRCPKCNKRKLETLDLDIPEFKKPKNISQKIITDVENIKNNKEIVETLEVKKEVAEEKEVKNLTSIDDLEVRTEEDLVNYTCSECGKNVTTMDIYCLNCGTRLLWEHLEEFNNGV